MPDNKESKSLTSARCMDAASRRSPKPSIQVKLCHNDALCGRSCPISSVFACLNASEGHKSLISDLQLEIIVTGAGTNLSSLRPSSGNNLARASKIDNSTTSCSTCLALPEKGCIGRMQIDKCYTGSLGAGSSVCWNNASCAGFKDLPKAYKRAMTIIVAVWLWKESPANSAKKMSPKTSNNVLSAKMPCTAHFSRPVRSQSGQH